jgi:preprotein translocase subunit SecG
MYFCAVLMYVETEFHVLRIRSWPLAFFLLLAFIGIGLHYNWLMKNNRTAEIMAEFSNHSLATDRRMVGNFLAITYMVLAVVVLTHARILYQRAN